MQASSWRVRNWMALHLTDTNAKVVYMCSSLLQLTVGSRDLSQAEKRITVVSSWETQKIITFFTKEHFEWIMWICSACKGQLISKGLFGILNSPKKWTKKFDFTTMYLRLTCFRSFFGRNQRHQKDISKLTDL